MGRLVGLILHDVWGQGWPQFDIGPSVTANRIVVGSRKDGKHLNQEERDRHSGSLETSLSSILEGPIQFQGLLFLLDLTYGSLFKIFNASRAGVVTQVIKT